MMNLEINFIQLFIIQSISKFLLIIVSLGLYLPIFNITLLIDSLKLSENSHI